ncbi:MAG TPA: sialidase family protein, partial [Thermoanaerobaculia bacterium]|nr:sialidase family protein [Thermoanaerobaculia bacterium]
ESGSVTAAQVATAATPALSVGTNRNVAAAFEDEPDDYQGEVQLALDPNDPRRIVAAANSWGEIPGACGGGTGFDANLTAVFYSSDGGVTWGYTCAPDAPAYGLDCTGPPLNGEGTFGSDPALSWDSNGNVFLEYMMICLISVDPTDFVDALVVARSTDGGATWLPRGVVKDSFGSPLDFEDKNFYVIDRNETSSFAGRHYTCWDRSNIELVAFSPDAGANWTEVALPTPSQGNVDIGCDLAVADDGTVHVTWNRLDCNAVSCESEWIYHSKSTDGGETWSTPPVALHSFEMVDFNTEPCDPPFEELNCQTNCPDAQDNRCLNGFASLDIDNSGGGCRGTLYAAYTDIPSGTSFDPAKANIYVRKSINGGATWSAAVMVNSGSGTSNITQFHPWLQVDRGTRHAVVGWHDTRDDSAADRVEFWMGRSDDCGASWSEEKVSEVSCEFNNCSTSSPARDYSDLFTGDNVKRNPNQYGEYLGLDVYGGRAFMAWTDSRHFFPSFTSESQKENVGFVEVKFEEIFLDGFETGDARVWTAEVEE